MGKAVIAIHGGAGAISRAQMTPEREREYVAALSTIVESGQKMLAAGASALDAVTLMTTGTNFLNEHIIEKARVHYAITDTGGFFIFLGLATLFLM